MIEWVAGRWQGGGEGRRERAHRKTEPPRVRVLSPARSPLSVIYARSVQTSSTCVQTYYIRSPCHIHCITRVTRALFTRASRFCNGHKGEEEEAVAEERPGDVHTRETRILSTTFTHACVHTNTRTHIYIRDKTHDGLTTINTAVPVYARGKGIMHAGETVTHVTCSRIHVCVREAPGRRAGTREEVKEEGEGRRRRRRSRNRRRQHRAEKTGTVQSCSY